MGKSCCRFEEFVEDVISFLKYNLGIPPVETHRFIYTVYKYIYTDMPDTHLFRDLQTILEREGNQAALIIRWMTGGNELRLIHEEVEQAVIFEKIGPWCTSQKKEEIHVG